MFRLQARLIINTLHLVQQKPSSGNTELKVASNENHKQEEEARFVLENWFEKLSLTIIIVAVVVEVAEINSKQKLKESWIS